MSKRERVLILGSEHDLHSIAVAEQVSELGGEAEIFDSAKFPLCAEGALRLGNGEAAEFVLGREGAREKSYDAVWVRRPRPHVVSEEYQADVRRFSEASSKALLIGGIYATARTIINPPTANGAIGYKPFQIALAVQCGLKVPETLITNDPEKARRAVANWRQTIYKTVTTWHYDLKETRLIQEGDAEALDGIRDCPVIFQELIEGQRDIRVTVVGKRVFSAAIDLTTEGCVRVDGRFAQRDLSPHRLPAKTEERLLEFHRRSGLIYGAYDFRLSDSGEYIFLEVNPEGQYLFVEIETGQPISRQIAKMLCGLE